MKSTTVLAFLACVMFFGALAIGSGFAALVVRTFAQLMQFGF